MRIRELSLVGFRNYRKQSVTFDPGIHLLVGQNGAGKTNLLEAIYVLSVAKSYRASDNDLINEDADFAKIKASVETKDKQFSLTMVISSEGKKAMRNQAEVKRLSDYIGQLNIISFLPEDLSIVKGSPGRRRYFVDLFLSQSDKHYLNALSEYRQIMRQRNDLLKSKQHYSDLDDVFLDVLNEQLSDPAANIVAKRQAFINHLNGVATDMYQSISGKNVDFKIAYRPSVDNHFFNHFQDRNKRDFRLGVTTQGPHRDDLLFTLDGHDADRYASQGEQRTMVLALDMALNEMIIGMTGEPPVFLLDDVFSELDKDRQNNLIEYLNQKGQQALITTTSLRQIDMDILQATTLLKIKAGTIKEERTHGTL